MAQSVSATMEQARLVTKIKALTERCHRGDAKAMLDMFNVIDDEKIANFWLLRAVLYGNRNAREILRSEPMRVEEAFLPIKHLIPGLHERWYEMRPYRDLQKLGIDDITRGKYYAVGGVSEGRVIIVGREIGYDPPDEDGFGAETYYDYYAYDEFFNRIPGLATFYSDLDALAQGKVFIEQKQEFVNLRIDWLLEDGIISLSDVYLDILKTLPHCILG